jgi:hypothetical protein
MATNAEGIPSGLELLVRQPNEKCCKDYLISLDSDNNNSRIFINRLSE